MRIALVQVMIAGAVVLLGCAKSTSQETGDAGSAVGTTSIPMGVFLGTDRVSPSDDGLMPDGQADYAIDVVVHGPIVSLTLVGEDSPGVWDSLRGAVWDTIVGDAPIPPGLPSGRTIGNQTRVVAAYERDTLLNAPDGSLTLGSGTHLLSLYASQVGGAAHYYRVIVELPDHTLQSGTSVMYY